MSKEANKLRDKFTFRLEIDNGVILCDEEECFHDVAIYCKHHGTFYEYDEVYRLKGTPQYSFL